MSTGTNIKLSKFEKELIQELSAISGHSPSVINEVLEFTFIRQIEKYFESYQNNEPLLIPLPFIGNLEIKEVKDVKVHFGQTVDIQVQFHPSDIFKRIIGEARDGNSKILEDLITSKIKEAILRILEE